MLAEALKTRYITDDWSCLHTNVLCSTASQAKAPIVRSFLLLIGFSENIFFKNDCFSDPAISQTSKIRKLGVYFTLTLTPPILSLLEAAMQAMQYKSCNHWLTLSLKSKNTDVI